MNGQWCQMQHLGRVTPTRRLFLTLPTTKLRKVIENIEIGVVWGGYSHSRSLEIAPFNRADTSSYKRSIVTMSLSCTVSEL